jgi:hypothetical protein
VLESHRNSNAATFAIDRKHATWSKVEAWILIAFAVLFLALPFVPDAPNPGGMLAVSVFGASLFGALGWWCFLMAKGLPVSIDKDGLWPTHLSKTALIRWEQIHFTRERHLRQRLDLLDSRGNVLIKLAYRLNGFEALRALLLDKIPSASLSLPLSYGKTFIYHLGYAALIAAFSLVGWSISPLNPWVGYACTALFLTVTAAGYLTTISRITLLSDRVEIGYPFRKREVLRAEVKGAQIGDSFYRSLRHPEVHLFTYSERKPIRLHRLGTDTLAVQQALQRWLKNADVAP